MSWPLLTEDCFVVFGIVVGFSLDELFPIVVAILGEDGGAGD